LAIAKKEGVAPFPIIQFYFIIDLQQKIMKRKKTV
jgi:hypothetical protein